MKPSDFVPFFQINYTKLLTPLDNHTHEIESFFDFLARRIKHDFNPGTVLDIGCDEGRLVSQLQKHGMQAWGIDFSELPTSATSLEAENFCRVTSPGEPLPRNYDLIVCIECLAYLNLHDAEKVVRSICSHTEIALFSSVPFYHNGADPTSILPPDYWAGLFSTYGFNRDLDYPPFSILPWSMLFHKAKPNRRELITGYERYVWRSYQENRLRRISSLDLQHELSVTEQWWRERFRLARQEMHLYDVRWTETQDQLNIMRERLAETSGQLALNQNQLTEIQIQLNQQEMLLSETMNALSETQNNLIDRERRISEYHIQLDEAQIKLTQLQDTLNAIYKTYSWKLILLIQSIRLRLAPRGSRREKWMHRLFASLFAIGRKFSRRH